MHLVARDFLEVKYLVDETDTTADIRLHDFQILPHLGREVFLFEHILQRGDDERERRAHLVDDVGEEVCLYISQLLLHLHPLVQLVEFQQDGCRNEDRQQKEGDEEGDASG